MAKPGCSAKVEIASGRGVRNMAWTCMRENRDSFTMAMLVKASGGGREALRSFLKTLAAGGFIECLTPDGSPLGTVKEYRLIRDNGVEAPRLSADGSPSLVGRGHEQMWRTLRMLPQALNFNELAGHASTAEVPVAPEAAHSYLKLLHKAGYLDVVQEAKGGRNGTHARYRLRAICNTGPRPPVIRRLEVIYDPNLRKVVYSPEIDDDDL